MNGPLAGYPVSGRFKGNSCVIRQRRVMHSPDMFPQPMDRTVQAIGKLIEELDTMCHLLEPDEYIELRRRMVNLYLDNYYIARGPYNHDSYPASS